MSANLVDNTFRYRMKHSLILTSSTQHSSSPIEKRCPTIWHSFVVILFHQTLHECVVGQGVSREGFNFKLAMVKTCSTWHFLNKYALLKDFEVDLQTPP